MQELIDQFSEKPWYHSVGKDQYGRHVVYVKYMCSEAYQTVPDKLAGKQVLIHLSSSLEASKEKFATVIGPKIYQEPVKSEEETEIDLLQAELFSLKRKCGEDNLFDILSEIHEEALYGFKPMTKVCEEFPEVTLNVKKLYEKWGCDVLFEEVGDSDDYV